MSLKGKHIGVAFTGSFCTYEKVFEELKKLTDEGAVVQTIFSNAAQTLDSRFGAISRRTDWDCPHFNNSSGRAHRAKRVSGHFDTIPLYRKHDCKTCQRHHRHARFDGGKSASAE